LWYLRGMTATTTQATQATTVPTLLDFLTHEEMALRHLEDVKRQLLWAQQEVGNVRADMAEHYTKEEIQQARKEGWGVIRD